MWYQGILAKSLMGFIVFAVCLTVVPLQGRAMWNDYIYGMHEWEAPQVPDILTHNGEARGWVLLMQSLEGYHGSPHGDVVDAANRGFGVVVRLHWGYDPNGTLPPQSLYSTFASNAAHFAQVHRNYCQFYVIANEPNLCSEWPREGLSDGRCDTEGVVYRERISQERYANVFQQCYHAMKAVAPNAKLALAPSATWAGAHNYDQHGFDVIDYLCFTDVVYTLVPHNMIEALAFHPKTRDHDPGQITNTATQGGFGCSGNVTIYSYFPVYQSELNRIPAGLRNRPIFLKELNPHHSSWQNIDNGYLVAAYNEVDRWNRTSSDRKITAMMVYRWPHADRWGIRDFGAVHQDLRNAVALGQRNTGGGPTSTPAPPPPTSTPMPGCTYTECFEVLPVWASANDSGAAANWTVAGGGHQMSCLQASRSGAGSSARVLTFAVTPGTSYTLSMYMRTAANYTQCFWMETAYKSGTNTAHDFNENSGTWTMIKKFDGDCGGNENGQTSWTEYRANSVTFSANTVSIGWKLGCTDSTAVTAYWDSFNLVPAGQAPPTNTPLPGPTNTPVAACGTLLSQGRPAFASSSHNSSVGPAKAVDGVIGYNDSRWVSAQDTHHWLYVDLGQAYALCQVKVYSDEANIHGDGGQMWNITSYHIRGSNTGAGDPTTWTLLANFWDECGPPYPNYPGDGINAHNTHQVSGTYRYVAIHVDGGDGECGPHARLQEFQIFGNTTTAPTPTNPPAPTNTPVVIQPTPTPGSGGAPLISQGRPAFASSYYQNNPNYAPSKAVDGVIGFNDSRWVSAEDTHHWLYVDLGQVYALAEVKVYSEEANIHGDGGQMWNITSYHIRGSNTGTGDPTTWSLLANFWDECGQPYPNYPGDGINAHNTHQVSGTYRYVAIHVDGGDGNCGPIARLQEFQIFGTASTQPTPTPSGEFCMGDANRDGFVNGDDFRSVRDNFGLSRCGIGDANGDCFVNGEDFRVVRDNFGRNCN